GRPDAGLRIFDRRRAQSGSGRLPTQLRPPGPHLRQTRGGRYIRPGRAFYFQVAASAYGALALLRERNVARVRIRVPTPPASNLVSGSIPAPRCRLRQSLRRPLFELLPAPFRYTRD